MMLQKSDISLPR